MEFWGVEVKTGETVTVKKPYADRILHISQACVGETKKEPRSELIHLYARKEGKKYLIGILSYEKFPNLNFDLVFEDDFELFHDSKCGSVHLAGYVADCPDSLADATGESEESAEDVSIHINAKDNGNPESKQAKADEKPATGASKGKVNIEEPSKDAKLNEEGDGSNEDDDSEEDEDSDEDEDMDKAEADSEENEDDSSEGDAEESEEEPPKKAEVGKKRRAEASSQNPASDKKAKLVTPVKETDGKKAPFVHVATPHPNKQAGKTPANNDKAKPQTPKSGGGTVPCSACNRNFGSDQALQAHTKAKHSAAK